MKIVNIPIHLFKSITYSLKGLKAAFKNEITFRLELLLCLIFIPLAFVFGHTSVERALLIATIILILIVELINSAIETIVDRIGKEHHELSGRAKDLGSAAVLIALICAFLTWSIILVSNYIR